MDKRSNDASDGGGIYLSRRRFYGLFMSTLRQRKTKAACDLLRYLLFLPQPALHQHSKIENIYYAITADWCDIR